MSTENVDTSDEDVVTPWDVKASDEKGINYERLAEKFGCDKLSSNHLFRLQALAPDSLLPPMLRREIFFAHRDFQNILDLIKAKKPFYLYTGRGPYSGSLHLGHMIPFLLTKWFQDTFDIPVIIQITDDEKYLWKEELITDEELKRNTYENIKDIISIGFKPDKTFIFRNAEYMNESFYWNTLKIWKRYDHHKMKSLFGIVEEDNIGKTAFPAMQGVPAFSSSFPQIFNRQNNIPCFILCAIDQDPYFQMIRKVASELGYLQPSLIYSKFLPALQGAQTKMSGSDDKGCIRMEDSKKAIFEKLSNAFTGDTWDTNIAYQYLEFFETDDSKLLDIKKKIAKNQMCLAEIKHYASEVIYNLLAPMQNRRQSITDETVQEFGAVRKLNFDY